MFQYPKCLDSLHSPRIASMAATMEQMQAQILDQQESIGTLRGDMADAVRRQNEDHNTFVEATNMKYAENRLHFEEIVRQAKAEFDKIRASPQTASEFDLREQQAQANLGNIVMSAKAEFHDIRAKLEAQGTNIETYVENRMNNLTFKLDRAWATLTEQVNTLKMSVNSGGPGSSGHTYSKFSNGCLPMKNMIPKTFTDKLEDWRAWQEAVEDFFDNTNPGMKGYLQLINMETTEVDDSQFFASPSTEAKHGTKVTDDTVQVWRALKHLTDGEARKVVMAVKGECGFTAWQRLKFRFEPSLAAKQGILLGELTTMVSRPAKAPSDLVSLITEVERKVKMIEDIISEPVSNLHKKSILVGILDPMTKQQMAMIQHLDFGHLREQVLQFANNMTVPTTSTSEKQGPETMQTNSCQQNEHGHEHQAQDGNGWDGDENGDGGFNVLGKGSGKCFNCCKFGHIVRNCPDPPKQKGKGKGNEGKEYRGGGYTAGYGGGGYNPGKGGQTGNPKGGGKAPMNGGCFTCGGPHFQRDCPNGQQKGAAKGGFRAFTGSGEPDVQTLCGFQACTAARLPESDAPPPLEDSDSEEEKVMVIIKDDPDSDDESDDSDHDSFWEQVMARASPDALAMERKRLEDAIKESTKCSEKGYPHRENIQKHKNWYLSLGDDLR